MNPAQMTVAKVLRAPWNFENDYATQTGDHPIFFTHPFTKTPLAAGLPDYGGVVDPEAIQATPPVGISPVLAKFVPCAMGSTMLVSFPIIDAPAFNSGWAYVWRIVYRLRSMADYARRKKHRVRYSVPLSRLGAADTRPTQVLGRPTLNVAGSRVVRPASLESAIYDHIEPWPGDPAPAFSSIFGDAVAIPANSPGVTQPAFYPGGGQAPPANFERLLDYEQGEHDPGLAGVGNPILTSATHVSRFIKCQGDEFAIECFKYNLPSQNGMTVTPRDWNFTFDGSGNVQNTCEDWKFSLLLGCGARTLGARPSIDTGVRVISGTSPP